VPLPHLAAIERAVRGGLSAVCATCLSYWEARDRGLPEPRCLAEDDCASPFGGDTFHEYQGPITDFGCFCFVCGVDPSFLVRVVPCSPRRLPVPDRKVGVCAKHATWLAQFMPQDRPAPCSLLLGPDGTVTPESLIRPPAKSLARAILEVETYFTSREG